MHGLEVLFYLVKLDLLVTHNTFQNVRTICMQLSYMMLPMTTVIQERYIMLEVNYNGARSAKSPIFHSSRTKADNPLYLIGVCFGKIFA